MELSHLLSPVSPPPHVILATIIEPEPRPQVYLCVECNRAFADEITLARHHQTHSNPQYISTIYQCPVCKKGFKTRGHLNRHAGRHYLDPLDRDYSPF
jgi:uncharacterized Zn-finger protein